MFVVNSFCAHLHLHDKSKGTPCSFLARKQKNTTSGVIFFQFRIRKDFDLYFYLKHKGVCIIHIMAPPKKHFTPYSTYMQLYFSSSITETSR
ncbi:MAG TPA: hypothetical protein DDW85_08675 [Porphyromonadaceae bacterium]|nr:hypothetical protein [Porphyromonadaceae bacterium]